MNGAATVAQGGAGVGEGSAAADKATWVSRVLGVTIAAARLSGSALQAAAEKPIGLPANPGRAAAPIRFASVDGVKIWQQAREAVNDRFGTLQSQLLGANDPGLKQIAELGLQSLSDRLGTRMMVALMEVDTAPADRAAEARARAQSTIADYRALLQSDPLVQLLDANPFGAALDIRGTLGDALGRLQIALSA